MIRILCVLITLCVLFVCPDQVLSQDDEISLRLIEESFNCETGVACYDMQVRSENNLVTLGPGNVRFYFSGEQLDYIRGSARTRDDKIAYTLLNELVNEVSVPDRGTLPYDDLLGFLGLGIDAEGAIDDDFIILNPGVYDTYVENLCFQVRDFSIQNDFECVYVEFIRNDNLESYTGSGTTISNMNSQELTMDIVEIDDVVNQCFDDCAVCITEAGTLSQTDSEVCLNQNVATITAMDNLDGVFVEGNVTQYLLTNEQGVILNISNSPSFKLNAQGVYEIHKFIYHPITFPIDRISLGVTSIDILRGLLIEGGGDICASVDVQGVQYTTIICDDAECEAVPFNIVVDNDQETCIEGNGSVTITFSQGGGNIPEGYRAAFLLVENSVIIDAFNSETLTIDKPGNYSLHSLVYDPWFEEIDIIDLGNTRLSEVIELFVSNGDVCAVVNLTGTSLNITDCANMCEAQPGNFQFASTDTPCFENGRLLDVTVMLSNETIPQAYELRYFLMDALSEEILNYSSSATFSLADVGNYYFNYVIYDPSEFDLANFVELNQTTFPELNQALEDAESCFALDLDGLVLDLEECEEMCDASVGVLDTNSSQICSDDNPAELIAFHSTLPNVPDGFLLQYLLVDNNNEAIIDFDNEPEFTVDNEGSYSIHGFVYKIGDYTIDNIILGSTAIADITFTLDQAEVCYDMDIQGVTINVIECVEDCEAMAATVVVSDSISCIMDSAVPVTFEVSSNSVVPAGFEQLFLLTNDNDIIIDFQDQLVFQIDQEGTYQIHDFIYDPNTFSTSLITTGIELSVFNSTLTSQNICYSLDLNGGAFSIADCDMDCDAASNVYTITNTSLLCIDEVTPTITITYEISQMGNIPDDYNENQLVVRNGIIEAIGTDESVVLSEIGTYSLHSLVYDPFAYSTNSITLGTTTLNSVANLFAPNGGDLCGDLNLNGTPFDVEECKPNCPASAGNLNPAYREVCITNGTAQLSASPRGNAVIPPSYKNAYILSFGEDNRIEAISESSIFTVQFIDNYAIHSIVYDPQTYNLNSITLLVQTIDDVFEDIRQDQDICASLDLTGSRFDVIRCSNSCDAYGGTVSVTNSAFCYAGESTTISGSANADQISGLGYKRLYLLSDTDNIIVGKSTSPTFTVDGFGTYYMHSMVYDPDTFDPDEIIVDYTTTREANDFFYDGTGTICGDFNEDGTEVTIGTCISLLKTGRFVDSNENGFAEEGEIVNFSFSVQNTGNTVLNNITIDDVLVDVVGGPLNGLQPGTTDNSTFSATYTLTARDIAASNVSNYAFVTANIGTSSTEITDRSDDPNIRSNFDFDGNGDPDDITRVPLRLEEPNCFPLACISRLNYSIDVDCIDTLTVEDVSIDLPSNKELRYELILEDEDDNIIAGNVIRRTHIGKVLDFKVVDNNPQCSNTGCRGKILIEDKVPPLLDCPEKDTVDCLTSFDALRVPLMNNIGCGDEVINITDFSETLLGCESEFYKKVSQSYVGVDGQGNKSEECTVEYYVERLKSIEEAPAIYDTVTNFVRENGTALNCTQTATFALTGEPRYNGIVFSSLDAQACDITVDYHVDTIANSDCKIILKRYWNLLESDCNGWDTLFSQAQLIEIVDKVPPTVTLPNATLTVNTEVNSCDATFAVPVITITDDCSDSFEIRLQSQTGTVKDIPNNGTTMVTYDVGLDTLEYVVNDMCGNETRVFLPIQVVDNTPPNPICKPESIVSLSRDGIAVIPATVFDNGSIDGCSLKEITARKVDTDQCGKTQHRRFSTELEFCCAEANTTVDIILNVEDRSGNDNTCRVKAIVQYNEPDVFEFVNELPNFQINCSDRLALGIDELDDLSIFGSYVTSQSAAKPIPYDTTFTDGIVTGGCNIEVTERVTNNLTNCGTGSLRRTFTITDGEIRASRTQLITITKDVEFTENQIVWPRDLRQNSSEGKCGPDFYDVDDLGINFARPRINKEEFPCDLIVDALTDEQVFLSDETNDACFKILREWTVINWCENSSNTSGEELKKYVHVQKIEIINRTDPVVTCEDIVKNNAGGDCEDVSVIISANATDDCGEEGLEYNYFIDFDADGVIETSNTGNDVSIQFPLGNHIVRWRVKDPCGNIASDCVQNVTIENLDKGPEIFCQSSVTTSLVRMDTDNDGIADASMARLSPEFFLIENKDSVDCQGIPLRYSFSEDVDDTERIYDCSDLDGENQKAIAVSIYVTNSFGDQSFCENSFLLLQDNEVLCGDTTTISSDAAISGTIKTSAGATVPNTELTLRSNTNQTATTNRAGQYAFAEVNLNQNYILTPSKEDDPDSGLSTIDILIIQRYLLQLSDFDNPYDIIASDVDMNDQVSTRDIVEMKKLILELTTSFTHGNSWRFVDAEHQFYDPKVPLQDNINENRTIINYRDQLKIDFVGIKLGDVNHSYQENIDGDVEIRSNKRIPFTIDMQQKQRLSGDLIEIPVVYTGNTQMTLNAIQWGWNSDQFEILKVNPGALDLNEGDYSIINNNLKVSWTAALGKTIKTNDKLFSLVISSDDLYNIGINKQKDFEHFGVINNTIEPIAIDDHISLANDLTIKPNPWNQSTSVLLPSHLENEKVELSIMDLQGHEVSYQLYTNANLEITVDRGQLAAGLYVLEIKSENYTSSRKMVIID